MPKRTLPGGLRHAACATLYASPLSAVGFRDRLVGWLVYCVFRFQGFTEVYGLS